MMIVVSKDGDKPIHVAPILAVAFYRAFREELWRSGERRDPEVNDTVLGVRIISLTR